MKRQSQRRKQPYKVAITGPGIEISACFDDGRGSLNRLIGRLADVLSRAACQWQGEIPDHYATLGMKPDASVQEVSEAYIRQIVKTLPSDALDRAIKAVAAEIAERNERERNGATTS
jgi:hypothetical protein